MRPTLNGFLQGERKMVSEKKPMLPVHAGESRYQLALDSDRNFREMILAAFALTLLAASGFGQSASSIGPVRIAFISIGAAGFGLRIVALRFAAQGVGTSLVDGPNSRLVAVVICGFGVLGSFLGGGSGFQAMGAVFVCTALILLVTHFNVLRSVFYSLAGLGLIAFLTWSSGFSGGSFNSASAIITFAVSAVALGISFFSNWNQPSSMQPALIVTSFAAYGWIIFTVFSVLKAPWSGPIAILAIPLFAVVERQITVRSAFAPIIVLLVLLHLSAFIDPNANQTRLIAPHLTALVLEFCLLGMAGYRHAIAALNRFPLATYRSSPQCLVPTLDHAWDHPVKIDAA